MARVFLEVKVISGAREDSVVHENGKLKVRLAAKQKDGRANKALIDVLARHIGVKKSRVHIVSGLRSREKRIEIKS